MPATEKYPTTITIIDADSDVTGAVVDDGGVQTDETVAATNATANDMTLLQPPAAPPVVNDAYYFAGDTIFSGIRLNIGTAGAGDWTITWEYWDGLAWSALAGVTDGTTHFRAAAGSHEVTFTVPSNWALTNVAGILNKFWIRARLSAFNNMATQPLGTQAWTINEWQSATNLRSFNGANAHAETDNAEVECSNYYLGSAFGGSERLDKVFVRIRFTSRFTIDGDGDDCSFKGYIRVYDGSSWQNYQVTADVYACTTVNAEDFTVTSGDGSNAIKAIDVTSHLDTMAKVMSAKTRLLMDVTAADPCVTPRWSVDCVSILVCTSPPAGVMVDAKPNWKAEKALSSLHESLKGENDAV